MAETGGSAVVVPGDPTRTRDLAAIIRSGLSGRLSPDEVALLKRLLARLQAAAGQLAGEAPPPVSLR